MHIVENSSFVINEGSGLHVSNVNSCDELLVHVSQCPLIGFSNVHFHVRPVVFDLMVLAFSDV